MAKTMTEGSPWKLILSFSIPLLLGNLFQQFYNMADAAIVGQTLGSNALASVGASSSVQFLILGFCMGIAQGFAIPIAQRFGAKDIETMQRYIFNGSILTAILAIIITALSALLCPTILNILQVNSELYNDAYAYLIIIFLGIPFTLLYNYLSSILRAIGDSRTPFLFLAFSAILNIGLDFFCILVLHWGCAGAAIATIFSQGLSGILCLFYIAKKVPTLHVHKQQRTLSGAHCLTLLGMGIPMGLQFSITAIGSMVMQSSNNALGTTYVSGFTAGMRIKQLMMCPFDAIGAGVSTFISQNYGAIRLDRIRQGYKSGLAISITYGIVACLVMITLGRTLSLFFVSAEESAVLDASALYLRRMGYFYPILGILIVSRMSIQGLGYSTTAVFGGVVEMFARTFVSLVFVPMFGYDAITWADQTAWTSAILYLIPAYLYCMKLVTQKLEQEAILNKMNG